MTARLLAQGEEAVHDAFVRAHPQGSPFHLTTWRDLVVAATRHRPHYLVAEQDGALSGVLPLFRVRSPLLGKALVSVPYGVYGGVLAVQDGAERDLLGAARELAEQGNEDYVELRQLTPTLGDLPCSDRYVTFIRDLPEDEDACLGMIPRKSRASTRHARDRHGMEHVVGLELLDDFYELFVRNKRSLGSPVFARSWFASILERFGDHALVTGVRYEGRIVAGVVSLLFGDTMMPYYSGAEPGMERLGAMNFMYWSLMCEAVRRGQKRFDFGRSRVETGAAAFKRNMGFEPTPLAYQYILRGGAEIPSVSPSNPKFDLVKSVWSRLPLPIVKWAGPRLMRYLP